MSGCHGPGSCATTAIRLGYGEDEDPFIYGRLQLFKEWCNLVDDMGEQMKSVALAWRRIAKELEGALRPWQSRGPAELRTSTPSVAIDLKYLSSSGSTLSSRSLS